MPQHYVFSLAVGCVFLSVPCAAANSDVPRPRSNAPKRTCLIATVDPIDISHPADERPVRIVQNTRPTLGISLEELFSGGKCRVWITGPRFGLYGVLSNVELKENPSKITLDFKDVTMRFKVENKDWLGWFGERSFSAPLLPDTKKLDNK
jgi:hypothetical protein